MNAIPVIIKGRNVISANGIVVKVLSVVEIISVTECKNEKMF